MAKYTITIKYTAPTAPVADASAQICALFYPANAAADLDVFKDTYYDTNVEGMYAGGASIEGFVQKMVAHPGLVAALRRAVADGEAKFETEDDKAYLLMKEAEPALADQGFEITVAAA